MTNAWEALRTYSLPVTVTCSPANGISFGFSYRRGHSSGVSGADALYAGRYHERFVEGPQLNAPDRALITVAALIARMQTLVMHHYFTLALDSGIKPAELSETILHLAFYSGFPNAMASIGAAKETFQKRGVSEEQFPRVSQAHFCVRRNVLGQPGEDADESACQSSSKSEEWTTRETLPECMARTVELRRKVKTQKSLRTWKSAMDIVAPGAIS